MAVYCCILVRKGENRQNRSDRKTGGARSAIKLFSDHHGERMFKSIRENTKLKIQFEKAKPRLRTERREFFGSRALNVTKRRRKVVTWKIASRNLVYRTEIITGFEETQMKMCSSERHR